MKIETETIVSMSEANQNFSKVARTVDHYGKAVILKNNHPRYIVLDFAAYEKLVCADDAEVNKTSEDLLKKNDEAYRSLAK